MNDTVFRLPGYWEVTQTGPSELILRRNPPWEEAAAAEDCDWAQDVLEMTPEEAANQVACLEPEQQALLMQKLATMLSLLAGGPEGTRMRLRCPTRGKRLTSEERDAIIDMFLNEKIRNKTEIARKIGTTTQTVVKILRQEKLIPRARRGTRGWMYY